jgi:hypothetical protein
VRKRVQAPAPATVKTSMNHKRFGERANHVLFDRNHGEHVRNPDSSCHPSVEAEGLAAGHGSCCSVMGESERYEMVNVSFRP